MVKKNKEKWVLIFWVESCETSIVTFKDISEVLKPSLIRTRCGDLPWVNRYGITTLYEATLLKISNNSDYLQNFIIDVHGKVLKKTYSANIMSEKKKLSADTKKAIKLREKNVQSMNESTTKLTKIGWSTCNNSSKINRFVITVDSPSTVDDSAKPSTSSEKSENSKNACENCKNCVCKPWRLNGKLKKFIGKMFISIIRKRIQENCQELIDA
ncbi:uncharacterized protein LOC103569178 [Microplitis demolitor]|uniref:uncharacterized protein LOC103569178 n=1 Tax=Microplitis demolitor TaxID=69319 RepID=UPI0004CDB06F|nr:uncharacterized protein LOC103569178 [Microplitis demolitor]